MKWPPNFALRDFRCKDAARTPVPPELIENCNRLAWQLQVLRDRLGCPVVVNSGYRTPAHNASRPGAAKRSRHMTGQAADIKVKGMTGKQVAAVIEQLIAKGLMENGGLGTYAGSPAICHYDLGPVRRWRT